jgi:hypothetical protein
VTDTFMQAQINDLQMETSSVRSEVRLNAEAAHLVHEQVKDLDRKVEDISKGMITENRFEELMAQMLGRWSRNLIIAILTLGGSVLVKWITDHM